MAMDTYQLATFNAKIATRGLSIISFNRGILQLGYDPSADVALISAAHEITELTDFAVQAINDQLDGSTPPLFPGLQEVRI